METRRTPFDSPYRFIVVPSRVWEYAVEDRAERRLVEDGLTRQEARYMVWAFNGRHGSEPRYSGSVSQAVRDLAESYV